MKRISFACGLIGLALLLQACSDNNDHQASETTVTPPTITPIDGETGVLRTSWVIVRPSDTESGDLSLTASLSCDSESVEISNSWLDQELLIVNPRQELPEGSLCEVSWSQGTGSGTSSFMVAATGSPAIVSYDRDDLSALAPFPDDFWLVESDDVDGRRLQIPLPEGSGSGAALYEAVIHSTRVLDGFSPVAPMIVPIPAPLDPKILPDTLEESLDPLSAIGLFVVGEASVNLGDRVAFYLLQREETDSDGTTSHNLIIFPGPLLDPEERYALVITNRAYVDVSRPLEPSGFLAAAMQGVSEDATGNLERVASLLNDVLPMLEENVSPPLYADDIALVLGFTVRSIADIPGDTLSMRDQQLRLPIPGYTIDSVEAPETEGAGIAAYVYGTWDVPSFRDGSYIARDEEGKPVLTGTDEVPFILALPEQANHGPVPITMYQHGQPGSAEENIPRLVEAGVLGKSGHALIGFTDIANREIIPGADNTSALTTRIFAELLANKAMPEYIGTLPRGEQLAFIRLMQGLGDVDVLPLGAPDGLPDLDVAAPLTYMGLSQGSIHGTGLVAYAPEIQAAYLAVAGGRYTGVLIHQISESLFSFVSQVFPGFKLSEFYVGLSLLQMGYDTQDPINHARYLYRAPHDLGDEKRASILVTEGLADTLTPPYSTQTAAWGFGIPHLQPVQRNVPFLNAVTGPVVGNISPDTTAALYQYVPVGVEGIAPTPGCETLNETNGHFCAQRAEEAQTQAIEFLRSAVEDPAPTIIDPLGE